MAAKAYKIFSQWDFPGGAVGTYLWKNLPAGKAYTIDVQPVPITNYQVGYNKSAEAEVTRVWRRFRSIQTTGSIGVNVEVRQDIRFHVRNNYPSKCHFHVFLVVVS